MIAVLVAVREKHQRITAGIPDRAGEVDLSLVKLPDIALMFPALPKKGEPFTLMKPRNPRNTSKEIIRKATKLGFRGMRVHDLRGCHETCLLDAGVPVHVVAARCGHDPAVLLRIYAKRTARQMCRQPKQLRPCPRGARGVRPVWAQIGSNVAICSCSVRGRCHVSI